MAFQLEPEVLLGFDIRQHHTRALGRVVDLGKGLAVGAERNKHIVEVVLPLERPPGRRSVLLPEHDRVLSYGDERRSVSEREDCSDVVCMSGEFADQLAPLDVPDADGVIGLAGDKPRWLADPAPKVRNAICGANRDRIFLAAERPALDLHLRV